MKMIDIGKMPDKSSPEVAEPSIKNKKYYPSFNCEMDMGMKMGQKVVMEGVVVGLRKDKYGNSTSIEVRMCGPGKMSKEEFAKLSDADQQSVMEVDVLGKKKG